MMQSATRERDGQVVEYVEDEVYDVTTSLMREWVAAGVAYQVGFHVRSTEPHPFGSAPDDAQEALDVVAQLQALAQEHDVKTNAKTEAGLRAALLKAGVDAA